MTPEELRKLNAQRQLRKRRFKRVKAQRDIAVFVVIGLMVLCVWLWMSLNELRSPAASLLEPTVVSVRHVERQPSEIESPEIINDAVEPSDQATRASAKAPVSPATIPAPSRTVEPGTPDKRIAQDEIRQAIELTIHQWANWWSAGDADRYIRTYSGDYEPEGGNRWEWLAQRRVRLNSPDWIKVDVREIAIDLSSPDRPVATFLQSYASPGYSDVVRKSLHLMREGQRWVIIRETTLEG